MHWTLAVAGLLSLSPPSAGDTPITTKDPAAFLVQLREMGYRPEPFEGSDTTLSTVLHLPDETLGMILGGCQNGRDCRYAVAMGSFNDVSAPAEWIAKMNVEYDLIKVWVGDDKRVRYSDGAIVEGIPRSAFKAWIDGVVESSDALAGEAVAAGLVPKP